MPTITLNIVQTFTQAPKGRKLVADQAIQFKTAEEAIRRAERAAESKAGVVAFVQRVDSETDEVEEDVRILFRAGQLPAQFSDN